MKKALFLFLLSFGLTSSQLSAQTYLNSRQFFGLGTTYPLGVVVTGGGYGANLIGVFLTGLVWNWGSTPMLVKTSPILA